MRLIIIGAIVLAALALFYVQSRRRLISRMIALVDAAQFAAYMSLLNDLEARRAVEFSGLIRDGEDDAVRVAAASTNFWFNRAPSEVHRSLDLPRIHEAAMHWLRRNSEVRKLIVQAVRTLAIAQNNPVALVVSPPQVLEAFGAEYPEAMVPDVFQALVLREIKKLPPQQQGEFRRFGNR
jgi:hypothetical protein